MLPYYALAALFVLTAVVLFAAVQRRGREVRVSSEPARGTPSPPRREAPSTFLPGAVTGAAPWALSAVPECFRQESEAHGTAAFVTARLPAEARRLAPGSTVAAADCTLLVGTDTLTLRRGAEHLIVPPKTRAFALGERLAVLREAGAKSDLRVYRRVSAGRP